MQVLPCSGVHYAGESNSASQGPEKDFGNAKVDNLELNADVSDDEQFGDGDWKIDASPTLEGHPNNQVDDQKLSSNTRDSGVDCLDGDNFGREMPGGNQECESSRPEPKWLELDQPMAVWVKWRGKWQAGIRCARSDWPLSTVRAKPTHDRKQYLVIFFPRKRNYSWADVLLLRSINECPDPIAYRSHNVGMKVVKDLTLARRFIMQKIALSMINTIEQLNSEALTETARSVVVWKDFAWEASRCKDYSDLGNMLLKLENMILQLFIDSFWLEHSLERWVQQCQNAHSAESIEMLKEELGEAINWNEVHALSNSSVQPEVGSEWKTLKPEVMKWFSLSNPSINSADTGQQANDGFSNLGLQVSRKRAKLEIRRAEVPPPQLETKGSNQGEVDSRFFNGISRGEVSLLGSTETLDYPSGSTTDRWGEIVVEAGNTQETRFKDLDTTPLNKNKQCTAFIEAKGRRCVRWANDGDVYCCVHLGSRFSGNSVKTDITHPPTDAQMCEGTTVLGTKCKHRSLAGTSFCKKHGSKDTAVMFTYPPENKLKRKLEEGSQDLLGTNSCKEIVLLGHFENPLPIDTSSGMIQGTEQSGNEYNDGEPLHCIGDDFRCQETPKKHTLYCEQHLPNWLKRARNGKCRIVSKEVFIDLLKSCESHEQKLHLHQACELFYRFFKSVLSLRSQVPKEIQLQWVMTEASKDLKTRHYLAKLVSREKERLIRLWGFNSDNIAQNSCSVEESVRLLMANSEGNVDESIIKCTICSVELLDDQMLAKHWIDDHKEEARLLFKRYVCAICLDSFSENKLLEAHVQERHHVQFVEQCMLYQCIPCGSRFGNPDQLWSHVIAAHSANFKLQNVVPQGNSESFETRDHNELQNVNGDTQGGLQRYICRFCGLKFDLLPDLGRHHQAAHMGSNPSGPRKRNVPFYANKLKAGRLTRRRFKKGLVAASVKIRNHGAGSIKKHIQTTFREIIDGESQPQESISLSRLLESECSIVAKFLYSKINKRKPRPGNLELLSVARSSCCKVSFRVSLEKKYGILPERLYLKAVKLCSEHNVLVEWHQEGFICPKGCKSITDSDTLPPLMSLPDGSIGPVNERRPPAPVTSEWAMDECHYIINFSHQKQESSEKAIVLCDDISFGKESVQIACVVDEYLLGSLHSSGDGDDGQSNSCFLPWESFMYITKPLLDQSFALQPQGIQLGCGCSHSTCSPKACDHVYLFDNDYEDARDIYGKPMKGRFPYDDKGRIILEEGYLVYECNNNCSCDKNCPNRILQNGLRVKLEVFKTEDMGWGVRAGEPIDRGTFVCEYIGEVIDEHEAKKRRHRYVREGCSYIYEIDARVNDIIRLVEGEPSYAIDATKYGNVSRYINHSCSPNLENHQVLIESLDSQLSHIGLYASRDIAAGENLSFDYMYKASSGEGCECRCGAANCRGRVR